jgi:uncharacterized protein (DUF1330 family)
MSHQAGRAPHFKLQGVVRMTTYLINHLRIPGDVPNDEALSYLEQVEATVAPHGGKWLAQGPVEVVEGAWPGSVVLMEFPSRDALEAWYHSPAYQGILPLRTRNAISDIVLIDSLPEGFTIRGCADGIRRARRGA